MRVKESALLLSLLLCGGCVVMGPRTDLAAVKNDVQMFARSVADGVTKDGPKAWQNYFENSPTFFMVVDGRMEFQDGAAVQAAMPKLTEAIKKIELKWGEPLRVDALTEDLAIMAAPWHELVTLADGKALDNSGYFTALIEKHDGHWQFRNAHWSTTPSQAPAR